MSRALAEPEPWDSDSFPFGLVLGDVPKSGADAGFIDKVFVRDVEVPFNDGLPVGLRNDAGELFEVD